MNRDKITLDSPIRDFWDADERTPEDGPEITRADCAYMAHEAAWLAINAHPHAEDERKWLLVARTMADMAIRKLDAEQKAKPKTAKRSK